MAKVPDNILPSQAKEKRALAERRQRLAAPLKKRGVVRQYRGRATNDGLWRDFIPEFLKDELKAISTHIFDEREQYPLPQLCSRLFGQGRLGIVEMQRIKAAFGVGAADGRRAQDRRRAGQFLTDGPDGQVWLLAGLRRRRPSVGDKDDNAESEDRVVLAIQTLAFDNHRDERILTKQLPPDAWQIGQYGHRIGEMTLQQLKTGGKVAFFERADDKIHNPQTWYEFSAFRTLLARAGFNTIGQRGRRQGGLSLSAEPPIARIVRLEHRWGGQARMVFVGGRQRDFPQFRRRTP